MTPNGSSSLAVLLQLASPAFPSGAFAHSYGIETLIQDGEVTTAGAARDVIYDWLRYSVATADAAAVYGVLRTRDPDGAVALSHVLSALRLTRELRDASHRTGAAFLDCAAAVFGGPLITGYTDRVREGNCEPHHAIAFGMAAADAGVPADDAVLGFLHSSLSNLLAVAGRLIPLGQLALQRLTVEAIPFLEELRERASAVAPDELSSAYAYLDLASMRHERLYSRLCMS